MVSWLVYFRNKDVYTTYTLVTYFGQHLPSLIWVNIARHILSSLKYSYSQISLERHTLQRYI